jgi:hypothetical protein
LSDRERGRWIFGQLKGFFDWWDWDDEGQPIGGKTFKFRLNGKVVCRSVWLGMYGICGTGSQYNKMRERVEQGLAEAYDKDNCNDGDVNGCTKGQTQTCAWMGVCSWFCLYAHCNGDYMPDRDKTVLPHIDLKALHAEYKADMSYHGRSGAASYEYFVKVWNGEPLLESFQISTLKYNFEHCDICTEHATALANAKTALERQEIKRVRALHLEQCKKERMCYEVVVRKAEAGLVTSLCIDGWSIWTTTAPHFCRSIKGLQVKGGIALKVTGAIVHGPPGVGSLHFYISDETVPHDTNLNVEVIRRTLLKIAEKGALHDTIHIQADNAGDNKNRWMFSFMMQLVRQGVGKKIVLAMLIVGHTHIDIDQKFRCSLPRHNECISMCAHALVCSIPAIHMKKMAVSKPILPTPEDMIDEWRKSYSSHHTQPEMEFIHAVRDIKKYFDSESKDGLDKLFGGYAGSRVLQTPLPPGPHTP